MSKPQNINKFMQPNLSALPLLRFFKETQQQSTFWRRFVFATAELRNFDNREKASIYFRRPCKNSCIRLLDHYHAFVFIWTKLLWSSAIVASLSSSKTLGWIVYMQTLTLQIIKKDQFLSAKYHYPCYPICPYSARKLTNCTVLTLWKIASLNSIGLVYKNRVPS